jgi:hypothetical protein
MSTTTSHSNSQSTVDAIVGTSTTSLTQCFPWLVTSLQSSPGVELCSEPAHLAAEENLSTEFAEFSDISDDWASVTWEATSEAWPTY